MLWLLKKFWHSLLVFGALVGLLYLPADLTDLPEAFKPIWKLVNMVDRETYLLWVACIFGAWIVWTDFRPFVISLVGERFGWKDKYLEERRLAMFENTASERFELARNLTKTMRGRASQFDTVDELHEHFSGIRNSTDVYLGIGELPNYIDVMHGGFVGAWVAEFKGDEAGLTDAERDQVASFYGTTAQLAMQYAIMWLQGEIPKFGEFEKMVEWKEANPPHANTHDLAQKLSEHVGHDGHEDDFPVNVQIRGYDMKRHPITDESPAPQSPQDTETETPH